MKLFQGDCLDVLKTLEPDSIDSLVTDPPAGISFMGKEWDHHKGGRKEWCAWMESVMRECIRVMKPGAHGLVWALPRTSHWTATALEEAGFEVRDCIYHLFGSGFPKSLDVSKAIDKAAGKNRPRIPGGQGGINSVLGSRKPGEAISGEAKQWQGWGTALKPAVECWWLVRKPISEKTVAANVLKWGTGALNIDSGRIPTTDKLQKLHGSFTFSAGEGADAVGKKIDYIESGLGRFPSHLILDEEAGKMLDAQSGTLKTGAHTGRRSGVGYHGGDGTRAGSFLRPANEGGASRFFYCAKVSASERNAGLDRSELVWNQGVWENAVLLSSMESASQLAKGISDTLMQHLESKSWSTDLYGQSISEQYPQGFKSIIETVLKLITELRTSNSSLHSNTKESILVALKMIEASGLSLVDAVAFSKKLNLATISDQTALLLSASNALLCELEKIRRFVVSGNFHSTVKPQKLMRYLCKLITPPGGTILDPFMGSGSTGLAAKSEGFEFVGIEREPEYFEIANARVGTSKNL